MQYVKLHPKERPEHFEKPDATDHVFHYEARNARQGRPTWPLNNLRTTAERLGMKSKADRSITQLDLLKTQ